MRDGHKPAVKARARTTVSWPTATVPAGVDASVGTEPSIVKVARSAPVGTVTSTAVVARLAGGRLGVGAKPGRHSVVLAAPGV